MLLLVKRDNIIQESLVQVTAISLIFVILVLIIIIIRFTWNIIFVVTYLMVDVYVMVSFLLALLFMLIGALQLSLTMICTADLTMCTSVRVDLTPAVKLMIFGVICNTIASYHLIGTIQGTWARFLGGLRHCCFHDSDP